MAGDEPYFGYTTAGNRALIDARRLAVRMGEDIRYYPPPPSDGNVPDFTVDYDSDRVKSLDYEQQTALAANDTIERIYKRVMAQDAGPIYQLSDQWMLVVQVIEDIAGRVLKAANALSYGGDGTSTTGKGWTGNGAAAFLARGPGATLKSLDDWKSAAVTNWLGSSSLASTIITHQVKMGELYAQYRQTMVKLSGDWLAQQQMSLDDIRGTPVGDQYLTYLRSISSIWSLKAQKIQAAMAKDYWSVMQEDLGGGRATVYEGPTDAVQPNPDFITRWQLKQLPHPTVSPPNLATLGVEPDVTVPDVANPDLTNQPPQVTPPVVTAPAPGGVPPVVVAPVLPKAPGTGQSGEAIPSTVRPPNTQDANRLLANAREAVGPGVLRGVAADAAQSPPPSLPQPPKAKAQPPEVKGRGPGQGTPGSPPGKRGPDESKPQAPGTPGLLGPSDQFAAPSGTPAAPVLRAPRATRPPSGTSSRRGAPSTTAGGGQNPLASGATPPVLNRPRPARPEGVSQAHQPAPPGNRGAPLAPPTPPTTRPVLGRSAPPPPGQAQAPERSSGVVRASRRAGSPESEAPVGSRRKGQPEQLSPVDREFERIRALLDDESAWTVETPGGGVLDSTPTRAVTPVTEPKPTLGT